MKLSNILVNMKETLKRDNERYSVVDAEHVDDLLTGYRWHFYPNKTKVSKDGNVIFDDSVFDMDSRVTAQEISKMLKNHFLHQFIVENESATMIPKTANGTVTTQVV